MKFIILLVSALCLRPSLALNIDEILLWEGAARVFLNKPKLEIYSLKVENNLVSFKYDIEDSEYPFIDIVFECRGKGIFEGGQPSFITLTCEEEEPTLWDEF